MKLNASDEMLNARLIRAAVFGLAASATAAFAHGDGAPQPVDTTGLPSLGADWIFENPFRGREAKLVEIATEIGSRGYNSNCARCHGLDVKSGGMAPDLRYLESTQDGDGWFLQRIRFGAVVGERQKMPPFDGLMSQEAMWAIRTYIETRPKD